MSDTRSTKQRSLCVATIASLLLVTSSCAPESPPAAGASALGGVSDSVEPVGLSDVEPVPANDGVSEAAKSSPGEPAGVGSRPETPDPVRNGNRLEANQVSAPKESSHAAKEGAVKREAMSREDLVSSFFPLSNGASWRYQLQVMDSNGETLSKAVVERRVDGTKTIDGKEYFRLVTTTVSGTDTRAPDQHYRVTNEGVVAAVEGVAGKELLVLPNDPGSKRSWSGEAPPIIKRVEASVTVGEQVACAAGVVRDCVRVDLDFVMRGAGFFGPSEVPVRIERWFASGIGMVRERRIAGGRTIEALLEEKQL